MQGELVSHPFRNSLLMLNITFTIFRCIQGHVVSTSCGFGVLCCALAQASQLPEKEVSAHLVVAKVGAPRGYFCLVCLWHNWLSTFIIKKRSMESLQPRLCWRNVIPRKLFSASAKFACMTLARPMRVFCAQIICTSVFSAYNCSEPTNSHPTGEKVSALYTSLAKQMHTL